MNGDLPYYLNGIVMVILMVIFHLSNFVCFGERVGAWRCLALLGAVPLILRSQTLLHPSPSLNASMSHPNGKNRPLGPKKMFRDIFRDPRPKAKSGFMDVGDATYWKGLHLDPSWSVNDLIYEGQIHETRPSSK